MTIKETVESAKFPVHKSGGYQCSAVDDLLTDVIVQAEALEDSLDAERRLRSALEVAAGTAQTDLEREQERSASLEGRLAEAQAAVAATPLSDPDLDNLRSEVATLTAQVEEFQRALTDATESAKADEEHIASLESYADEVERNYEAMKADRDKIRSDAEGAIRTLSERLAAASSTPTPVAAPEPVVEVVPPVAIEAVIYERTPEPSPAPTPEPSPAVEAADDEVHQHTPSITTPTSTPSDDAPVRPRLMRRG